MLNVVIVEDEFHNRENLKALLQEVPDAVKILGEAGTKEEAVALIKGLKPDLVLMDIELNEGTGFDVLSELPSGGFEVVFTTAFEHYALKAIKFSSIDYLLKPIGQQELNEALDKARQKKDEALQKKQLELLLASLDQKQEQRNICLSTSDGIEFIKTAEILYCEASGSYTHFHLKDNHKLLVSKNLKEYSLLLDDQDFMRVHNSFLINLKEVKRFVKSDGGYILMNSGANIPISGKKRDEFLRRMAALS